MPLFHRGKQPAAEFRRQLLRLCERNIRVMQTVREKRRARQLLREAERRFAYEFLSTPVKKQLWPKAGLPAIDIQRIARLQGPLRVPALRREAQLFRADARKGAVMRARRFVPAVRQKPVSIVTDEPPRLPAQTTGGCREQAQIGPARAAEERVRLPRRGVDGAQDILQDLRQLCVGCERIIQCQNAEPGPRQLLEMVRGKIVARTE